MRLLTRKERSLWGLIVFAFPQDKESSFEKHRTQKKQFSFSSSLRVFPSLTCCSATALIARIHYYDVCLELRTVDSCGNSTCLKTPQSGFLEEAEAVPAESNGPQW